MNKRKGVEMKFNFDKFRRSREDGNAGKKAKRPGLKSIIALSLSFVLMLSCSFAYFTDYLATSTTGTAGTVQISMEDNINLLNADGQDILNPGDIRPVQFTIKNDGNKSVDYETIIKLTSSVPMMDRLDSGGNGSVEALDDDLTPPITLGEGDPDPFLYEKWSPYASEYELYWAKDIVAVEGYGHYPKAGDYEEGNIVYPLMDRYVNAARTQIVYVLDKETLSGNETFDEREMEYRQAIDMSKYSLDALVYCGGYHSDDLSEYGIDGSGVIGNVYFSEYEEEIDSNLIYVLLDEINTYDENDKEITIPMDYYIINDIVDYGVKHISVSQNVKGFLYENWDATNYEYTYDFYTVSELKDTYGIEVHYYDDIRGFSDPAYAPTITAAEYNKLSDEEKANCTLVSDSKTYDIVLLFDPNAGNEFQNSSVSIEVEVRAKQHRNTDGNWELVAKTIDASINTDVFTIEYDTFGRLILTGVQDGVDLDSLTEVEVPVGVQVIPQSFFEECSNLETVVLPSTIEEIGASAFSGCTSLKSIEIPKDTEYIGYAAFSGCTGLKEVFIPSGIKVINEYAFRDSGVETVEFEEGCTEVSYSMFYDCANLTTVKLPSTMKYIRGSAFNGCTSLTSIDLPEGLIEIGSSAFYETNLTDIVLPKSLESLDNYFLAYTPITHLNVPKNVQYVGKYTLGYSNITSVTISPENKYMSMNADGTIIYDKGKTQIYWYKQGLTTIDLSDTNITKMDSTFNADKDVQKIILPDSVKTIDNVAFARCSNLTSINFPEGLETIGSYAFDECDKLKTIAIPDSVTNIYQRAFDANYTTSTTVYTNNDVAKSYNWSGSKRNVTFKPYEDYNN